MRIKLLSDWYTYKKGKVLDVSRDTYLALLDYGIAEKAPDRPVRDKMMRKNKVKLK